MEKIALPDTYATFEALKPILEKQGYELSKTTKIMGFGVQDVRLMDVFLIAPFLIFVGVNYKTLPPAIRATLVSLGAVTLLYNGFNYLKNKK